MAITAPANVTELEDAKTARWLEETLRPARARVREGPTAEAIDRIRARVLGETHARRKDRRIAA